MTNQKKLKKEIRDFEIWRAEFLFDELLKEIIELIKDIDKMCDVKQKFYIPPYSLN